MRILVVHEVEFVSKVVYEWQEFPEVLEGAGHDVAVLDYDSTSSWHDLRRWGLGPKLMVTPWRLDTSESFMLRRMIGPPIPGTRRLFSALASWTVLRRVITDFRPDVILTYAVPTCGLAVLAAAQRSGIPVVFRSIDVLSQLVPKAIAPGVHVLERAVYARCSRILVANPQLDQYVRDMSGGRARTAILLSPIDAERFAPLPHARQGVRQALGIPANAALAVFVGSIFDFIGVDRVIESWGEVQAAVPNARLLVVGGGPDEERLRRLAHGSPQRDSIVFTGMQPYDRIPSLIAASDVGLCPFELRPVTRDVNPIKIMQYLSCAVPCVCTPLDGTVPLLPEERSGVVYAMPGDAYTDAVIDALSDSVRSRALGAAGRDWVQKHHARPAVVSMLLEELAGATAEPARRAPEPGSPGDLGGGLGRLYDLHGDKLRFLAVGIFNTGFGYLLFLLMLSVVKAVLAGLAASGLQLPDPVTSNYYLVAQWTAWVLSVPVGTSTMKTFAFKSKGNLTEEIRRSYLVYLPAVAMSSVLLWFTVRILLFPPETGQLLTIALSTVFSYVGHKYFTFRIPRR